MSKLRRTLRPDLIDEFAIRQSSTGERRPAAFGTDVGVPPDGGFQVNVFLRMGDTVYRTYNTQGRGTEQVSHTFPLIDLLPYGRQEDWQDSPEGWPQSPAGSKWGTSEAFAQYAD